MENNMRVNRKAWAQRRPHRSAKGGTERHPRTVPMDKRIVPNDASRAAPCAFDPAFPARNVSGAGEYTEPAHSPMMETSRYDEFRRVRRRYSGENSIAMALRVDSAGLQRAGSCTP